MFVLFLSFLNAISIVLGNNVMHNNLDIDYLSKIQIVKNNITISFAV